MDMTGEIRIAAARERVWQALNDPEVLKKCIPGCESLDKISDTEFTATATNRIGPLKAKFGGKVELSDIDPPNGYTISGEGQGGVAGFARGGATIRLSDDGAGTVLHYTVKASVGGKLAQIGSRLVDQAARKLADDFFDRFVAEVGGAAAQAAPEPAAAPLPVPDPDETPGAGLGQWIWVGSLLGIMIVLLLILGLQ